MKAINNRLPLRKVLTYSLLTAQVLGTQFTGSYAFATKVIPPEAQTQATGLPGSTKAAPVNKLSTTATKPKASTVTATAAAKVAPPKAEPAKSAATAPVEELVEDASSGTEALDSTAQPVASAAPTTAPAPLAAVAVEGNPKFKVIDGDEEYIVEAKIVESTLSNPQYGFKDGQTVLIQNPEQKRYSAELTLTNTEGEIICAGGCFENPDVTSQLHNLNAPIEAAIKKSIGSITKQRKEDKKKKEKEDKLLKSCKAVRSEDGEIIRISSKNRMEFFEDILDCQVSRATEDKDENKNDEDLSLKELRSKEIGGLIRRAMTDEDEEVRSMAQDAIEKLESDFGDSNRNVRSYLNVLGKGAEQMDDLYQLRDQADSNPQARAQILAEMDRAVGAWNPQNYSGKSKGYVGAADDIHRIFKAVACDTLGTSVRAPSGGSNGVRCDADLDKAIGDGYSEKESNRRDDDNSRDDDDRSSKDGFRRSGNIENNNGRLQRVSSSPSSGALYDRNQRLTVPSVNPGLNRPQQANGRVGSRFGN